MLIDEFEYTDKGGRNYNEDSIGSSFESQGCIFVVADGLGGHVKGDEASACAVNTAINIWQNSNNPGKQKLEEIVEKANDEILNLQQQYSAVMKSTIAALAFDGLQIMWVNVGDSRVYYFHNNELAAVTEDHSVAYKKYKAGEITRDMIGQDEDQSSLLRTLGNKERHSSQVYVSDNLLETGDAFLICSDGAWEYLRDEEILFDMIKSESAKQWAEYLLLRIHERVDGSNDNLSILTIKIEN